MDMSIKRVQILSIVVHEINFSSYQFLIEVWYVKFRSLTLHEIFFMYKNHLSLDA